MNPIRASIESVSVEAAACVFRWLPLRLARLLAEAIGLVAAHVIRLRRDVALDNMKHAFPDMSRRELGRLYSRCWRHFARVGAELARLPRMDRASISRWVDLTRQVVLEDALKQGKGAIVVSGHFGNWEWMGGCIARMGYPVTYVVADQTNPLVDRWLDRMRRSVGVETVRRDKAVRGVLSALRRNRAVAILCDQDAGEAGVFVPFFGRPASIPRGPALFHLRTGVPIIFSTAPVGRDGRYRVTLEEMHFTDLTGERDHDEEKIMQQITRRLETEVRRHPEQWLWLHRRWKSSPGKET